MSESACSVWTEIEAYLERRGERAVSLGITADQAFESVLVHLAECGSCRDAYIEATTALCRGERAAAEAHTWAAATGCRAAVTVGSESLSGEAGALADKKGTERDRLGQVARGVAHTAEAWLQHLVEQARAFRLEIVMPSELVFVGTRSTREAVAPQQFPFDLESLAQGGWDPRGTAWISPREVLLQLNPIEGIDQSKVPRFVFRSNSDELLWLDEPPKSEMLGDGSHLFLAWRLDSTRAVEAQVRLPLDGFVWFSED